MREFFPQLAGRGSPRTSPRLSLNRAQTRPDRLLAFVTALPFRSSEAKTSVASTFAH